MRGVFRALLFRAEENRTMPREGTSGGGWQIQHRTLVLGNSTQHPKHKLNPLALAGGKTEFSGVKGASASVCSVGPREEAVGRALRSGIPRHRERHRPRSWLEDEGLRAPLPPAAPRRRPHVSPLPICGLVPRRNREEGQTPLPTEGRERVHREALRVLKLARPRGKREDGARGRRDGTGPASTRSSP